MRRRQAIHGVLALALPVAGCAGTPAEGTTTGSTDADRTGPLQVGETATVGEYGELTVTSLTVQRAVSSNYLGLDGERVDPPTEIEILGYQPSAAVAVPVRAAERAAVVLNSGSEPAWALPDEQVGRLSAAPEFALRSATFDHESATLTLVVENSGDRDGTFRGGVDYGNDYTTQIEFPVAVGETHTETVDLSPPWEPSRDREFDVTADTRVLGMAP